jgi:hypothetical protein
VFIPGENVVTSNLSYRLVTAASSGVGMEGYYECGREDVGHHVFTPWALDLICDMFLQILKPSETKSKGGRAR